RAPPPPAMLAREEQGPSTVGENWFALVGEIEKARAAQDQDAVTTLLERLRLCDDPALVEYLFARLCQVEEADLWVSLLALQAARRLGPSGEIFEIDQALVTRVLAVISLTRDPTCRERVAR